MARIPKSAVRIHFEPAEVEAEIRVAMADFIPELAAAVRDQAQASTAFRDKTGKLRKLIKDRHITVERPDASVDEYIVQASAPHAHLVEFGHAQVTKAGKTVGFTKAHPFLTPALEKVMSNVEAYLPESI